MELLTPHDRAALLNLIAACEITETGFRQAAAQVDDDRLRTLLHGYADQHATLAAELRTLRTCHSRGAARRPARRRRLRPVWLRIGAAFVRSDAEPETLDFSAAMRALHDAAPPPLRQLLQQHPLASPGASGGASGSLPGRAS